MASINEEIMEQISYGENEKKLPFISFNLNKSFIYVVIYWILEITFQILYCNKRELFYMINDEVQNEYMFTIFLNLADLFSGFLVLYIKKTSKSIKEAEIQKGSRDKNDNKNIIDKLISKNDKKTKKNYFTIKLIIIGIFDYLSNSLYWIAFAITDVEDKDFSHLLQKDIVCVFDILMRYIFSIIILKNKIFKHHKFAIIIILITLPFMIPLDIFHIIFFNKEDLHLTLINIGIVSIKAVLFPLEDTIVKKVYLNYYILPEYMMFVRGLGDFLIILIITPILYFSLGIKNIEFDFDSYKILILLFYTLSSFIKAYLILKVIYFFSAQSVSFFVISESIGLSVGQLIKNTDSGHPKSILLFIAEIIVILFTIFATLVYDEIIVIQKCDLDKNIVNEITRRSILETKSISILDNGDDNISDEEDEMENDKKNKNKIKNNEIYD